MSQHHMDMLARENPHMAKAMLELSRPDETILGWPSTASSDGMETALTVPSGSYIVGAAAVYAAENATEQPTITAETHLTEKTPATVQNFYSLYKGHVGAIKEALAEIDSETENVHQLRDKLTNELAVEELAKGSVLLGGYALLCTVGKPRIYTGVLFIKKSLLDRYAFSMRDAALQGTLKSDDATVQRNRLTLGQDISTAGLAQLHAVHLLPDTEALAVELGVNPDTGVHMTRSERKAFERNQRKARGH
jgi:hypothetical protein